MHWQLETNKVTKTCVSISKADVCLVSLDLGMNESIYTNLKAGCGHDLYIHHIKSIVKIVALSHNKQVALAATWFTCESKLVFLI